MRIHVSAYLPSSGSGPGRLTSVPLDLVSRGRDELVLPEATIRDERGLALLDPGEDGDVLSDPSRGGAPTQDVQERREAMRFGLTNAAFHTQRALRAAGELAGVALPHLVVRIGLHDGSSRRWGGGHYRVAAQRYEPPEADHVRPGGEVHLGGGSRFVASQGGGRYFAAPAHNLAILCHEIGHHLCRHTADFRLNGARPQDTQTNKKIALDEGTCDFFAAVMLDSADIYGWHRSALPLSDHRRRALGTHRTMASFEGGASDPHVDGTIWASACWTTRNRVVADGHDPARFDAMVFRGLRQLPRDLPAPGVGETVEREALKSRRYFGNLLEAMLRSDPALSDPVLAGMAAHGIQPGLSNAKLRDAAQAVA